MFHPVALGVGETVALVVGGAVSGITVARATRCNCAAIAGEMPRSAAACSPEPSDIGSMPAMVARCTNALRYEPYLLGWK